MSGHKMFGYQNEREKSRQGFRVGRGERVCRLERRSLGLATSEVSLASLIAFLTAWSTASDSISSVQIRIWLGAMSRTLTSKRSLS